MKEVTNALCVGLLGATQRPEPQTKLNHPTPIDHHYEQLRTRMRELFTILGMAA
jgi:hypothetical protein